MPISSTDISAIMAAQQAYSMNQVAHAAAITPGGSPGNPVSPPSVMDPRTPAPMMGTFPGIGSQMGAGMVAGAVALGTEVAPFAAFGIAGARESAMGLSPFNWGTKVGAGSAFSLMDPFTTTGRSALQGFWGGAGINQAALGGGQGLGATLRHIGQGNVGAGALGRGAMGALGGAALPLLGYAALGAAADFTAGNVMTGAQEYMSTQGILGSAGRMALPNIMSPGGVGFSPGDTQDITRQMRNMAGQDPFTSMGDMQGVMASLTSGGHMRTVQDARQFQTKFRELTGSMKEIAEIYNTTLQEAGPILQRFKSMGYGTPQGAVGAMQQQRGLALAGGITSQGMEAAGAVGAQISRAAGGLGTTGAVAMTRAVGRMGVAVSEGMIDPAMLTEATGGLTGEAANLSFSRDMYTRAQRLLQGKHGRHVLAFMMGEGGELDAGKVSQFMSGDVSYNEMLKEGATAYKGKEMQAAYKRNKGRLGSELLQTTGPMAFVSRLMEMRIEQHGQVSGDEDVRGMLTETFGQMSRSQADVLTRLVQKGGELDQSVKQKVRQKMMAATQEAAYRKSGTMESFKRRLVDEITEPLSRPIKEMGDAVSRWGDEVTESIRESVTGIRKVRTTVGEARLYRDISSGDLSQSFTQVSGRRTQRSLSDVAAGAGPGSLSAWGSISPFGEDSAEVRRQIAVGLGNISELSGARMMGLATAPRPEGYSQEMQQSFNEFYSNYRTNLDVDDPLNAAAMAEDMRRRAPTGKGSVSTPFRIGLTHDEFAFLSAGARRDIGRNRADVMATPEMQQRFAGLFSSREMTDEMWAEKVVGGRAGDRSRRHETGIIKALADQYGFSNVGTMHMRGVRQRAWAKAARAQPVLMERNVGRTLVHQMLKGDRSAEFFAGLAMGTPSSIGKAFESIGADAGDLTEERIESFRALGQMAKGRDVASWVGEEGRMSLYLDMEQKSMETFAGESRRYGAQFEEMLVGTRGYEGALEASWGEVSDWYAAGGKESRRHLVNALKESTASMSAEERVTMYKTLAADQMTGGIGAELLIREKRMKMLEGYGKGKGTTYEKTRRMLVGLGFVKPGFGKGKKGPEREALEAALSTTPDRAAMQAYFQEGGLLGEGAIAAAKAVGGGGILAVEYEDMAELGRNLAPEIRAGTTMAGLGGVVAAGKALADAWRLEANEIRSHVGMPSVPQSGGGD